MNLLFDVINIAFQVYIYIIFARIILSWIRHDPYNPVFRFIYDLTEPFLSIFRRIIPPLGMIDLSPIVALIALHVLRWVILSLLLRI
ncbi:MAG: YggT family protein [Desulforudis sp.]|jgi:YggT family protein|nr:YggT family protein [Clostridia bacterium]MDQ7791428.1 YggT family protein [Clostridia bacterium]RJX16738.1 MAG: YggT family protein [Desulforudis sp.]